MKYCFGVDIGGTTVKMGLIQANGDIENKWEVATRTDAEGVHILPDIARSLKDKMTEYNLQSSDIMGVGVGVPAPVSKDGVVNGSANLGWTYKEVEKELKALMGMPVKVGNDANVAALGEMWKGGGCGNENMIMVTLGTGVGGGIIVEGRAVNGAHGSGGEIGHICVNENETGSCGCGKKGCLEYYVSAPGIARLAKERLVITDRPTMLAECSELSAKSVFEAVGEGDEVAIEIAEEFGRYLGYALANVSAIIDPAVIVIGGGVSRAGKILLDYVEKYFKQKVFFGSRDTEFELAKLGNDAGICGAAKMIIG